MENILPYLWQMGIPTYRTTIFTPVPATAELQIPLPKQLPTQIGRILGLSIYADTVAPDNSPLITSAQSQFLYLVLKHGATDFFDTIRLDDLLFSFAGLPGLDGRKYLSVNIPGDFDLSTSFFWNPGSILSPGTPLTKIALNIWYVSTNTYHRLLNDGYVLQNAISMKGDFPAIK